MSDNAAALSALRLQPPIHEIEVLAAVEIWKWFPPSMVNNVIGVWPATSRRVRGPFQQQGC
jgi:hypothetical protein